jgi:hypothetical protein
MNSNCVAIILVGSLNAALGQNEMIVLDKKFHRVEEQGVIITEEAFSPTFVKALSEQYRQKLDPRVELAKLVIATDRDEALRSFGPKPDHFSYQTWSKSFEDERSSFGPLSELLMFKGNAVLRMHMSDGTVRTEGIGELHQLSFKVEDDLFELLEFSSRSASEHDRRIGGEDCQLMLFFVTSSRQSLRRGKALTRYLVHETGIRHMQIYVRNDPWFVSEAGFPTFYRFAPGLARPSREAYLHSPQVTCITTNATDITCYDANLH